MGVLLDIVMPNYCYDCPCHDGENGKCNITNTYVFDKRPFDCPLQEEKRAKFVSEIVKKPDWKGNMQSWYNPNSCSNCHTALSGDENYCPNCGAKMIKEEKNHEKENRNEETGD